MATKKDTAIKLDSFEITAPRSKEDKLKAFMLMRGIHDYKRTISANSDEPRVTYSFNLENIDNIDDFEGMTMKYGFSFTHGGNFKRKINIDYADAKKIMKKNNQLHPDELEEYSSTALATMIDASCNLRDDYSAYNENLVYKELEKRKTTLQDARQSFAQGGKFKSFLTKTKKSVKEKYAKAKEYSKERMTESEKKILLHLLNKAEDKDLTSKEVFAIKSATQVIEKRYTDGGNFTDTFKELKSGAFVELEDANGDMFFIRKIKNNEGLFIVVYDSQKAEIIDLYDVVGMDLDDCLQLLLSDYGVRKLYGGGKIDENAVRYTFIDDGKTVQNLSEQDFIKYINNKASILYGSAIVGLDEALIFCALNNIDVRQVDAFNKGGKICHVGTKVQTLLFSKDVFTKAKAVAWAKKHKKKYGIDEKPETYRMRQIEPSKFDSKTFRTITFAKGLQAVIGCPKKKL